jgi:hypothetical protein
MKFSSLAVAVAVLFVALGSTRSTSAEPESAPASAKPPGYSIELIEAQPKPDSVLAPGSAVDIQVKVKYSMTASQRGLVVLVLQDSAGGAVTDASGKQPSSKVEGPSGSAVLSARIIVPARGDLLHVFVPVLPDGASKTQGEVRYSYRIAAKGASPSR